MYSALYAHMLDAKVENLPVRMCSHHVPFLFSRPRATTTYELRFPAHIAPSFSKAHISSPSSKSPSSMHLFRPRPKAEATSQASHSAQGKWSTWTHGLSSSAFQKSFIPERNWVDSDNTGAVSEDSIAAGFLARHLPPQK